MNDRIEDIINWPSDPAKWIAETYCRILMANYDNAIQQDAERKHYHDALVSVTAHVCRYTFDSVNLANYKDMPNGDACFNDLYNLAFDFIEGNRDYPSDEEIAEAARRTCRNLEEWGRAYMMHVFHDSVRNS